jgi:uncharacterized membrane protein
MNYHVLLVHFPIALLVIYSLLEIFSYKNVSKYKEWFYIKFSFLIIGVISAFPTISTGEILEDLPKYDHKLVELHASFASASSGFYLIIAIIYILSLIVKEPKAKNYILKINNLPKKIKDFLFTAAKFCNNLINKRFLIITSIIGLVLITITGALGGVLTSGINVDPIASFIYYLFF